MLSEPVKALFESNTNARHAGDADRLAKEHKPNGVHVLTDLPYGIPDQLRKLDLYRPETQHEPLPVIIDFHGGGLYHGDKQNTMCRDMYLAKYGFAVVNANYRLVPQIGFQDQLHDALDAIIWTNEHAHDYGMDTNALFLIGDSADNTLEFARILQYRHHDYELRLLPKGLDHALVHDFAVKEVGLEHNEESQQIVKEAATFFKRYRPTTS